MPSEPLGAATARQSLLGQRGAVIWLTGLSGAGKTTIGVALEHALLSRQKLAYRLDGDSLRTRLSADLDFSRQARDENIRRASEVAHLFADAGLLVICAFISPYHAARDRARAIAAPHPFFEIFVDASLEVCEKRDPRGLYARARSGKLTQFTGISAPYEVPRSPDLRLDTSALTVSACTVQILSLLHRRGVLEEHDG